MSTASNRLPRISPAVQLSIVAPGPSNSILCQASGIEQKIVEKLFSASGESWCSLAAEFRARKKTCFACSG